MSVDWGYRCLDCGVDSDITLNNAEDELTIIAQQYHHLFAFRAVDSYVITIDLLYHSDILTFLDAHHTHHIAVVNECNEAKPIPRNDTA